jgi:hypothetical protein
MAHSHRRGGLIKNSVYNKSSDRRTNQIMFSKEQSMLLDMWNEKHI